MNRILLQVHPLQWKAIITTVIIWFSMTILHAQITDNDKKWAVSVHAGTGIMLGDGDYGGPSICGGAAVKYSLANNFSLRLMVSGGNFYTNNCGQSGWSPRTYNTATNYVDYSIQSLLNIVNFRSPVTGRNTFQLYVGIGVGIANVWISYTPSMPVNEFASLNCITLPMCAGLRYFVNSTIDVGFEYSIKEAFTDDFDGYRPMSSSNYSNDFYVTPTVFVNFNLGKMKDHRSREWTEHSEKVYEELLRSKKETETKLDEMKKENTALMVMQQRSDSVMTTFKKQMIIDTDSDGVPDVYDKDLHTPKGATVDGAGRPLDVDNDGIPDYLDRCPTVHGKAANHGCPIQPNKHQLGILLDGIRNLQFETGKAEIKAVSFPSMDALAQMLIENPSFNFIIEGHTDNVGNADDNMKLSVERAEAVKNYMVQKGVEAVRISANGYGDTRPVVSNETAAGKAKNRRVDMTIE